MSANSSTYVLERHRRRRQHKGAERAGGRGRDWTGFNSRWDRGLRTTRGIVAIAVIIAVVIAVVIAVLIAVAPVIAALC